MKESPRKKRVPGYLIFFILAAGVATVQLWQMYKGRHPSLPEFGSIPALSLTTSENRTFTRDNFKGKVTITDFIFTSCAGPCPFMSGQMQQLQTSLKEEQLVQFVSFSVDPETDTPDVLAEYGQSFGAIPGKWFFLTGPKKEIYDAIRNDFHLAIEDDENSVAHSTKFVLVDKDAQIRGYYDSEDDESLKKLVDDARSLL